MEIRDRKTNEILIKINKHGRLINYDSSAYKKCLPELVGLVKFIGDSAENKDRRIVRVQKEVPNEVYMQLRKALSQESEKVKALENEVERLKIKALVDSPPF